MANRLQQISSQIVNPPAVPTTDELQFMCRICSNSEVSINVYSELGKLLKLEEKIKTCLRLELSEGSPYPNNVCLNCLGKVNISYELHQAAIATQTKITQALTRAGIPVNQLQAFQSNGLSPGAKYNPKIESVQSLGPNAYTMPNVMNSSNAPVVRSATPSTSNQLPKKAVVPSPAKRSASPDTPSKKERKTVCSTCGEWFFKSELAAHTKQVHHSITVVYGCVNCSANFTTQHELTAHSENCS